MNRKERLAQWILIIFALGFLGFLYSQGGVKTLLSFFGAIIIFCSVLWSIIILWKKY